MQEDQDNYEKLITELIDRKFGIANQFLSHDLIIGLRDNLLKYRDEGQMQEAGIGRKFDFQKNSTVRGDLIRWIDPGSNDPFETRFMTLVGNFVKYLNRTCYTNINDYEFHYAYYEEGSFYKRHLDQFKSNRGRKYSMVCYLNDNWEIESEGNLILYLEGKQADVYPKAGRSVLFKSDEMEHEVKASISRPRLSIAGWLKNTD